MMKTILKAKAVLLLFICLIISSIDVMGQITSFLPASGTAGTTTVLTITGTGFGTGGPNATMYVEFRNADDGGATYIQPLASEYISWSTTQIIVRIPTDAGTGTFRVRNGGSTYNSATSLNVPYDLMNVISGGIAYKTDHINKTAGGYVWQMFTGFDANAPAKASFTRSLETWRCATFINWQLGTTTTLDAIAADGVNVVRFDKAGQELPAGVLGRCTSRWTACSSGGTWEWWVYELDIEFDQATAWQFGPAAPTMAQYDFESVSLHELGHGHQLGHVNDGTDVMNYAISNGATRRTLNANDINGGLAVMARSTAANLCTPAPMVPLNTATCLLSCPSSPANDAICSATVAPVNGTCLTSQTNVCSTGDITGGCLTSAKTVWYSYTLTGGNNQISITFGTYTFGGSVETALYSGACGAPVFVGSQCGLPTDTYRFTGLAAGTYRFGVSTVAGLEGNFSICATQSVDPCVVPPANDAICSPTVLPVNGICVTAQNNCPATADYNLGCAVSNKTLWYKMVLTGANDQVKITLANTAAGFGPNVDFQLYSGACATPVAVAAKCGTKTSTFTFTGLTSVATTYTLGISTDAAYTGLFDICATQSINPCTGNTPANDAICSARTLPVDATCLTSQTNVCASADYTSGCASSTNTVWYKFNLTGINSVIDINFNNVTLGGGGAVEIMLASGLCTTPTFVSTYCGLTSGTIRFTALTTLTTYYLSVSTVDGNQGTFDICASQSIDCGVSTPVNDAICSATVAPVNGTCLTGQTNLCATPDTYGGCVTITAGSVYYSLTVTAPNNALNITFPSNTFGSALLQTYLFSGACASAAGVNSFCASAASTFTYTNLVPGTYFLSVATEPGQTGDFTICATQYQTPPGVLTGPMQDCQGAIPMCASTYNESNSYIGFGNQELPSTTCLGTRESNSVWYSLSPQTAGTFAFTISTLNDYDFSVYDLTSYTCADIPSLVPVRCNWSGTPGNTGLTLPPSAVIPLSQGGAGVPTMAGLNVVAGSKYVIVVDNYSADNNGYTISFTGTAQVFDNTPPVMSGISSCSANQITLTFNEDIKCDSLDVNEFILIDPITGTDFSSSITSVSGLGCGAGLYTNQVIITHNGSFPTATYQLITNKGKIQDKCSNRVPKGTIFTFDYLQDILVTSNVSAICVSGNPVVITANGGNVGAIYTLNPGGLTNSTNVLDIHGNIVATTGVFTVTPFSTTQYTVSTVTGTCVKSNNVMITLVNNVVAAIDPVNVSICAGTTTLNASATVNGVPCVGCSFQWSGASTATTPSINVGAGTYNLVATTLQGCPGTNTATSTVSIATAGVSPSCNIFYVSPAGGGDGLTKGAPTTLQNALTQGLCQTAIIKMQKGIYTLTDKIDVNSFATIEGGYDAAFTVKSSDMTGANNSTTIRRTNATDSDNINTCTAFRVVAGANGFLFQDLRIEMPGSAAILGHTTGLEISNYGIKLGAGCTGYNIIRCYIDAGRGSN